MSEQRVVVMGLGNLLWADEGFGVRVAGRLYAHYHWPEDVEIVDGGTQGLNLLGYVESASHLLILDAIDYGLEPGTLRTYAGERIPAYLSAKKMSLHQNSFSEVLALADIRGHLPAHIALVGLQPAMLDDYGGSLSELAREQLPAAEQAALVQLAAWELYRNRLRSCAVSIMTVCRWKITKAFACVSTRLGWRNRDEQRHTI